jgi:OOP family OmpA-OmpF porin
MRLRAVLFAMVALGGAGAGAWWLAGQAAARFEERTGRQIAEALTAAGQDWARADVDGLEVALTGAAPDETSRFRVLEIVKQVVDERRITDATTVRAAHPLAPPPFALELLRNEAEVSLIGLVPQEGARDAIRAALDAGGLGGGVTDMLETADQPAPAGWTESLGFGLEVLGTLPRAKISVEPGRVRVVAVAATHEESAQLEARLTGSAPEGVGLELEISAPRPVIAPFAVTFTLADGAGRFEDCSAESPEAVAEIMAAARATGLAEAADCAVGLGAPSPDWAAAVAAGLGALREMGGGRFAIRDLAAELTGPAGVAAERVVEIGARLDADLPAVFALSTVAPPTEAAEGRARANAPTFSAVLHSDGTVRLSGPVQDAASRAAVHSYAAALFGHDRVTDATLIDPGLPDGWPGRVLAGIEALSALKEGRARITADRVAVEGSAIEEGADAEVEALLAAKVGRAATVRVRFDAAAADAAASAARIDPQFCAAEVGAILAAGSIRFGLGSAEIARESHGVIAAIADVLRGCPGAAFEVGGHTDTRGGAVANQRLSEARAWAVKGALEAEGLPQIRFTARGYGAARPIADNASEEGRASNRRIALTLLDPEAVAAADAAAAAHGPQAAIDAASAPSGGASCAEAVAAILAERSIEFAAGSADIEPGSRPLVAAIAEALGTCSGAAFEIGGHTDSQGSTSGNLRLSEARAQAVLAALEEDGVAAGRLSARGYGEAEPVADNATSEGRARNRRIAFSLVAAGSRPAVVSAQGERVMGGPVCAEAVGDILADERIEFAAGSSTIEPASQAVIAAIAEVLGGCPGVPFEIGGHTDAQGSTGGNRRLSEARAEAVLEALEAAGLSRDRLTARGYGEEAPVADNSTSEGRAQNRRIAFMLVEAEGSDDAAPEAPGEPADEPR